MQAENSREHQKTSENWRWFNVEDGLRWLPNNQQCFNYAESTPMDNSTRTQGPSESVHDVPCCEPADRYSISDPGTYHLAQRQ